MLPYAKMKKYNRKHFVNLASNMVKEFDSDGFDKWIRPGIRAQLLNIHTKELLMDFVVEGDKSTIHVLNAVSPAFTCSLPFSRHVIDNYII